MSAAAPVLTKSQKALVQQFIAITSASEAQAIKWLRRYSFSVESATNAFFDSGEAPVGDTVAAESAADTEFLRFVDRNQPGQIGEDGLVKLCSELGLDLFTSPQVLVLCHRAGAAAQGRITKEEWKRLFSSTTAKSVADLKAKLPGLASKMAEPFWTWVYKFSCAEGQKSVEKDTVVALLGMLAPAWPLLGTFTAHLEAGTKTLTKDSWAMLLPFMAKFTSGAELRSKWEESDAETWPTQLDEYREWMVKTKQV